MVASHFAPESIAYLRDLRDHNDKSWFEANRFIYETYLLDPLRHLASQLAPVVSDINPAIETRPQVGKTISRIYRDTRFSQNKLPYRDHVWLEFRDRSLPGSEAPQFYFYFGVEEWGYGMGFWQASTQAMAQIRQRLETSPELAEKLLSELQAQGSFTLGGEKFKRLRFAELPPRVLNLYNHRTFYFIYTQPCGDRLFAADLWAEVAVGFQQLEKFYCFLLTD